MIRGLFVAAVLTAASTAAAQPMQQGAPSQTKVDTTGWTLLGTQAVQGKRDKDTIIVGKYEGKFDQVQLVVADSDIDLKEMMIEFANGEKWSPALKHTFKEGQRSKALDLPGNNRTIAKITLAYANTPGGGKATVSIYARDKKAAPKPPAAFDPTGWTLLGAHSVDRRRDKDTIAVGKYQGKFDQLQMVVADSDIDLKDFTVVFGNGERFSPKLKHTFKEGQRTKAIDLPGADRTITAIELAYANTAGGGKASVAVYGRDTKQKKPEPKPSTFDPTGWTMLGTQTVNGSKDKDKIKVGKYAGQFDQLTMVVHDSDLELSSLTVAFARGEKWSPALRHTFKEGTRSHVIDLPGKDRTIKHIELAYGNLPGGGKARVEVYGRDAGRPAPPPPTPVTWDNKGWTMLGKTTADGWRDRDRLDVTVAKPFSEVMFVVTGSDVELRNVLITLGNREKFEMPSSVIFKEGTRTAPIDIPGKLRLIKSIDFAYANLAGGGRASIEVWARAKATAVPPVSR